MIQRLLAVGTAEAFFGFCFFSFSKNLLALILIATLPVDVVIPILWMRKQSK